MFKKLAVFSLVVFFASFFFNPVSAQSSYKIIPSDVIKVNKREPTRFDTGRNFVNNKSKKKKVKSKVKYSYGHSCPGHFGYFSDARSKRQKKLNRNRR